MLIVPEHTELRLTHAQVQGNRGLRLLTSAQLFGVLQKGRSSGVYASAPLSGLQFTRCRSLLVRGRLLQPLGIGRVGVLGFALLVVTIAEAEGVVVIWLGIGCHRGQRLPLLAA